MNHLSSPYLLWNARYDISGTRNGKRDDNYRRTRLDIVPAGTGRGVFLLVFPLSASSKVYEIEAFLGRLVANSLADHN